MADDLRPGGGRAEALAWAGLAAYCALLTWFNWNVLPPDLAFSGDPGRWLGEAYRLSLGEVPYRDFSWQYPPLSIYIYGWAFRVLGASYGTASLVGAVLSTVTVLLSYAVARRFVGRPLALAAVLVFATAGAFNFKNFALFGLRIYSPAILVGYTGLLALVLGIDGVVRDRAWRLPHVLLVLIGTFVCLSAKPEFALSAMLALTVALAVRVAAAPSPERGRVAARSLLLGTGFLVPPLAFYGWVVAQVGLPALIEGIAGYGMAALSCPWWPTGVGLLAVGGALAVGTTTLAGLLSLDWRSLDAARRRSLVAVLGAGVPLSLGAVAFFAHIYGAGIGPSAVFWQIANFSNAMLAALWISIGWLLLRGREVFGGGETFRRNPALQAELVLLAIAIVPSVRSLFSKNAVNPLPIPAMASYPLLCVTAFVVADRVLARWTAGRSAAVGMRSIPVIAALYCAARVLGFAVLYDPWPPLALRTRAGTMLANTADAELHGRIYRYLEARVPEHDTLGVLGYTGGWEFALHARSPLFLTQSIAYAPSEPRLAQDRARIESAAPRFVIAPDDPDRRWELWGLAGPYGCPFPRLVWRSDVPSDRPEKRFPAGDYVREHYVPRLRVPGKAVLLERAQAR